MKIRDKQGRTPVEIADNLSAGDDFATRSDLIEKDKTLSLIEEGLNELNTEQQLCVTLFYLQKQTYQQIADATGLGLLQVKSCIQNGKRNLKLIVEKKMKQVNG